MWLRALVGPTVYFSNTPTIEPVELVGGDAFVFRVPVVRWGVLRSLNVVQTGGALEGFFVGVFLDGWLATSAVSPVFGDHPNRLSPFAGQLAGGGVDPGGRLLRLSDAIPFKATTGRLDVVVLPSDLTDKQFELALLTSGVSLG